MAAVVNVKAVSFLELCNIIVDKYGAEGLENVKAAMKDEDRVHLFADDILPISWLDVDAVTRFGLLSD